MSKHARSHLLLVVCVIGLSLLFFFQLAFSGKILARGDAFQYFYPYWDARNAAFRAGELPLWSPELFMGAPLLANPQVGVYYPPNWLTAPLRAPAAIALSIVLHAALALAGTIWLFRLALSKRWLPAFAAGIAYAFGGVILSHVEQINQLQGLAWLPLLFALYHRALMGDGAWRAWLLLALAWSMQIFSGHTQTVFISGLGLAVYGLSLGALRERGRIPIRALRPILPLALCFGLALLLALPQLLPSLELMELSNRSGGLSAREATAFSLPPRLLGRALLPSYDGQLFGEYVASLGLIGLGLALWGVAAPTGARAQRGLWSLLAVVGFGLALGRFNPLYMLLAEAPGFDLFRVPARFLALFALAMAMLAGLGVEALARAEPKRRPALVIALLLLLLIIVTRFLLPGDAAELFGGTAISDGALLLWLGAGLALTALLLTNRPKSQWAAVMLLTAELFLAASNLPFNDLAPADVYLHERQPISQLRALQTDEAAPRRTLSASQIYFDPLDIAQLRARYGALGMDWRAQFHALDAVKMQETLYPNLALTWGTPSLDGFGGGITPSRAWSLYASLLLPETEPLPIDGRLGERMAEPHCWGACLPPRRWLDATDTAYLITDRVFDVTHEGIAYDTALSQYWAQTASAPTLPDFADEARILHREPLSADLPAAAFQLNEHVLLVTKAGSNDLDRLWTEAEHFLALTALDSRQPEQQVQLQPPPFERVYQGAVKIFQLPGAGKRAFLADEAQIVSDDAAGDEGALELLRAGAEVALHGGKMPASGELDGSETVVITIYEPDEMRLEVESPGAATLVLAEAWHPGWRATVNGEPAPLWRANLVFRALPLPAGASDVRLVFAPELWRIALYIGIGLWSITLILLVMPGVRGLFRRAGQREEKR